MVYAFTQLEFYGVVSNDNIISDSHTIRLIVYNKCSIVWL